MKKPASRHASFCPFRFAFARHIDDRQGWEEIPRTGSHLPARQFPTKMDVSYQKGYVSSPRLQLTHCVLCGGGRDRSVASLSQRVLKGDKQKRFILCDQNDGTTGTQFRNPDDSDNLIGLSAKKSRSIDALLVRSRDAGAVKDIAAAAVDFQLVPAGAPTCVEHDAVTAVVEIGEIPITRATKV